MKLKAEQSRAPYYIKFHIGDYIRDCEELSLLQHGVYLRLMLWYYSIARAIPNDLDRIYRRIHATSAEEKHAAQYVLGEFFVLADNLWRHKRIDRELTEWQAFMMASQKGGLTKARKSAEYKVNKINETRPTALPTTLPTTLPSNQNQNHSLKNLKDLKPLAQSDPAKAVSSSLGAVVITMPLADKSEFPILAKEVAEWEELYPGVDVMQTLKEIRGWNLANPTRRKTKAGILRHVNQWLAKEQNYG